MSKRILFSVDFTCRVVRAVKVTGRRYQAAPATGGASSRPRLTASSQRRRSALSSPMALGFDASGSGAAGANARTFVARTGAVGARTAGRLSFAGWGAPVPLVSIIAYSKPARNRAAPTVVLFASN